MEADAVKFSTEHVLAGLALIALGYVIGQRRASAAANRAGAVVPSDTNNQADWWTYAGAWRM